MPAEPYPPDELEELRRILLSPDVLAANISDLLADTLRQEVASSPGDYAQAIAPAVGEAFDRRARQEPETLAAALRPVIAEIVKEELDRLPQDLAAAVGEAIRCQIQAAPEAIAAALYPAIRKSIDQALSDAKPEPAEPAELRASQDWPPSPLLARWAGRLRQAIGGLFRAEPDSAGDGDDSAQAPTPSETGPFLKALRWFRRSRRRVVTGVLLLALLASVGSCGWWVWRVEHTFGVMAMEPPTASSALTSVPTDAVTPTVAPTTTPTLTFTPSPTPSPTATPSPTPTPTPRPMTLAVDRDVYDLSPALFALLPAQHAGLVVLPYTSRDPGDDALATQLASWTVRWAHGPVQDGLVLREEPYVVAAHPLATQQELTLDELVALAGGQDQSLRMVVGDSGKAVREVLGLEDLALGTVAMPDWASAKEYVATHRHTWALLPWEAVDFRVQVLPVEGVRPNPADLDGYPLVRRLWLTQRLPAPPSLVDVLRQALPYRPPATVELVAVGDIMLDRHVGEVIEENSVHYPFEGEGIRVLLSQADIAFANLECPISDRGTRQDKGYEFRADPEVVDALVEVGLDVVSLANNHTGDYADLALADTMRLLTDANIIYVGAGHDLDEAHQARIVEVNGLRVAFLAYNEIGPNYFAATRASPGSAFMDPERMAADVEAARRMADIVLVSCHWGTEYIPYPSPTQEEVAQALADAGADLVIGHHPHVVQGMRYHQGALTTFSLGNFIFDQAFSEETSQGLALRCLLDASGVKTVELLPVYITDCQPALMSPEEGAPVLERIMGVTEESGALPSPSG